VLSHLLREGVSRFVTYGRFWKRLPIMQRPRRIPIFSPKWCVRHSLGRTITKQYLAPDGSLPIIGLDPRLDRSLADQANAAGQGNQVGARSTIGTETARCIKGKRPNGWSVVGTNR
jgi:hypothetical protein